MVLAQALEDKADDSSLHWSAARSVARQEFLENPVSHERVFVRHLSTFLDLIARPFVVKSKDME